MQIPVKKPTDNIFESNKLPILLYAGQILDEPDWKFPSHKHENLSEIIYISEGQGEFVIDNVKYLAKKGDILIYNKGVLHDEKSAPQNPLKTYFCGVGNLFIKDFPKGYIIPKDVSPLIQADKYSYKIENYISNIFEECYSQISGYELICQNLLISLIVLIHRIIKVHDRDDTLENIDQLGIKIKEYIDKNYTKDLSLKDIANRLYISPDYLSHVFKDNTGYSPVNYMITRRIGEAKKLLLNTNKTIQEISYDIGYQNTNYFSMLFKKVTGISPSAFRNSNKLKR